MPELNISIVSKTSDELRIAYSEVPGGSYAVSASGDLGRGTAQSMSYATIWRDEWKEMGLSYVWMRHRLEQAQAELATMHGYQTTLVNQRAEMIGLVRSAMKVLGIAEAEWDG